MVKIKLQRPKAKKSKAKSNGPRQGNGPSSAGRVAIPRPGTSSVVRPMRAPAKAHHAATCSITDPFCVHARGAQRPDGGPPTVPFQIRILDTILLDGTSGTARTSYVAGGNYYKGTSTTVTGNWNYNGSWSTHGYTFFTNNAREFRVVSFGCIVRSAMTATTAKGSIILTANPSPFLATQMPKGSMAAVDTVVLPLAAGTEYSWRSKPLGPSAHLLRQLSTYTSSMSDFDWMGLDVEVVGGDTTNNIPALTVEYVCNVEFTLASAHDGTTAQGNSQLQRTPPKPNVVATRAADVIHATAPSFIQGGIDYATNQLEKLAFNALKDVATFLI